MAKKYRLGVVDEYKGDRDLILSFFKFFDDDTNEIEAVEIPLVANMQELVQNIIDSQVDAVAVDFNLKEYANLPISFLGNQVCKALQEQRFDFPMVILTNYTKSAEVEKPTIDGFHILPKEWFAQEEYMKIGKEYSRKIKNMIEVYQNGLKEKKSRLLALHDKQKTSTLSLSEETELIELDEYLEKATGGKSFLPKDWKKPDALKKINDLADTAEKLLEQLKK